MIPYIINVGLILAGCISFYKLLLQKETFYRLNRWILIICLIVSFGIPLIPMPQQWSLQKAKEVTVVNEQPAQINNQPNTNSSTTPRLNELDNPADISTATNPISFQKLLSYLVYLYWFGVIAFAINFLMQVIVLLMRAYRNPVIVDGPYRIVEVSGSKAPYSFANNIFINPEKYDWETYSQIIQHEKVHIQQSHTLDIVIAELALIFQWFNPFAWVYRKEVESNLEFLTDDYLVSHKEVERSSYQLSLLKVSSPNHPLSIATNYNQSLLKKRIVMMNAKRSNFHAAWKYFFLLPLLIFFACLLNQPVSKAQPKNETTKKEETPKNKGGMDTVGSWVATIQEERIAFQFKSDEDEYHPPIPFGFELKDFPNLPRGKVGTFKLTREAGTMEFTGKFEGDLGTGKCKFIPDKDYETSMANQFNEKLSDWDLMVFFLIDIKKSYPQMLKDQGYTDIDKDGIIPLAASNVTEDYIKSMKSSGIKNLDLKDLLHFRSYNIDGEYINSLKSGGLKDIASKDLIPMKSLGVTAEYVKSFQAMGYTDIRPSELIPLKAQHVTPEYIKGFESLGFKEIPLDQVLSLKEKGITPAYIKSMREKGFNFKSLDKYIQLKSIQE